MFEKLGNKQREVNRKVSGDPTVFGLTYSMQSTVEEAYTPGSFGLVDTFNTFNMKRIWIEPSQCTYYSDNCTALGQRKQNGKTEYLMLIHPQSESIFNDLVVQNPNNIEEFKAIPLSSSRSLLLKSERCGLFMAKVSLNATIGSAYTIDGIEKPISRRINEKDAGNAVANSILTRTKHHDYLKIIEEPAATTINSTDSTIFRDLSQFFDGNHHIIPMFSLLEPETGLLEFFIQKEPTIS